MLVIRAAAAALKSERLIDCDLYVTLEPCPMCAAAISFARMRRLYFGASDPKSGGVEHGPRVFSHATCHHAPEIYGGLAETESSELLKTFFSLTPPTLTPAATDFAAATLARPAFAARGASPSLPRPCCNWHRHRSRCVTVHFPGRPIRVA